MSEQVQQGVNGPGRRAHRMPFGAELQPDGSVRFALWAPHANSVSLCLYADTDSRQIASQQPMTAAPGGWFRLSSSQATAGSHYRFSIDDELAVPDPASRYQPQDVSGPSQVFDPYAFHWQDDAWRGRPWEQAVLYELHVGAFSGQGDYAGVEEKLDYLVDLGVTAIELMPLADFPGQRNWGYDGVLPFAPDSSYGHPDALKALIQTAHLKGVMVLLDVVYNHFGPQGNYLARYAPDFFTSRHHTPWGDALNFDGPGSETVRDFFLHNALYWLEEFHFDGLRLDAVHSISDSSRPDILEQLAAAVADGPGRHRQVHLVLENDHNAARYLHRPETGNRSSRHDVTVSAPGYTAQWNDDIHHALHILLSGETDGYYEDYADQPVWYLGRCLAEGFAYQGERSVHRDNRPRGEPSWSLRPTAFVAFLQNHDQVGNRAFGERLTMLAEQEAVRAASTILLLAPAPPLLFMGEEFAASTPFYFFCDFSAELSRRVTEGRRGEFARFQQFADPASRSDIPDPAAASTFAASKLNWNELQTSAHRDWWTFFQTLLQVRRTRIVPLAATMRGGCGTFETLESTGLRVRWQAENNTGLELIANLGDTAVALDVTPVTHSLLFAWPQGVLQQLAAGTVPPWSAAWFLRDTA